MNLGHFTAIANAEEMVLGAGLDAAERFLKSEFDGTKALTSACAGYSATGSEVVYVLVSEPLSQRGIILELAFSDELKWVVSNIGELTVERGKARVLEAHGGIATYQHLGRYADSLNGLEKRQVETIQLTPLLETRRRCCVASS